MVYPTNQNRHFYLAKALKESSHKPGTLTNIGDIAVNSIGEGNDKQVYFVYKGVDGVTKSDYIPVKNIDYIKPVKASQMITPLKEIEVTLDSNYLDGGNVIAGQDYVLRLEFRQFFGGGDDNIYIKDAAVHATAGMTASAFYKAMVEALNLAFSREVGATKTSNPYLSFSWKPNGVTATQADAIVITEKEQDWNLGTKAQERVLFEVFPTTIFSGGDDVIWAAKTGNKYYNDVTASNTTVGTDAIGNGKKIADIEWFCMGERGDQYRMIGWPNYVPTKYLVDPSEQYNVLEIHFAFTDTGVNSYRSEKDITIAVPLSDTSGGGGATIYDDINDLIDEIEYHTGLTIAGLVD